MSDKPKIFLTRELPPQTMQLLQEQAVLTMNHEDRYLTKAEIMDGIGESTDCCVC